MLILVISNWDLRECETRLTWLESNDRTRGHDIRYSTTCYIIDSAAANLSTPGRE